MGVRARTVLAMSAAGSETRAHLPMWPLLVGGFLGPFGGGLTTPMLPELGARFGISLDAAAWSLTAYLLPFAVVLLVSGTLGDQWGRRRTVRNAYIAYAAASVLCVLAPTFGLFLGGRALQGVANAFTTPLLVTAIFDAVAPGQLGRWLGRFGGMQAAGMALAPLAGGLAAAVDYRWAFAVTAGVALLLALVPPRDHVGGATAEASSRRWRVLANRQLARAGAVAVVVGLAQTGAMLLTAVYVGEQFGLGPRGRGLVIAAFGVAGLLLSGRIGHVVDRFGVRRAGALVFGALAVLVTTIGFESRLWLVVLSLGAVGAAVIGGRVIVNSLAVRSTPENPGGATSLAMAVLFLGSAVAPLLLLPAYGVTPELGFALIGVAAVVAAVGLGLSASGAQAQEVDR
jgi:predicted MFS family arabinose efflux permease